MSQPSPTQTPPASLSRAALAAVGLAAVVAHLPALAGYFFADDWGNLARAAAPFDPTAISIRPLTTIVFWKIAWGSFGFNAPAYHATALLLWAASCLLVARIGFRLGLAQTGAIVAGLVAAGTPVVVVPIFWASAFGEILAVGLALAVIDRWLAGGSRNALAALFLAWLSFLAKESALLLVLVLLALLWLYPGPVRRGRSRGQLAVVLAGIALGALVVGVWVFRAFPHHAESAYALAGATQMLANLGGFGAWLSSPWNFAPPSTPILPWIGLVFWILWTIASLQSWRRGIRQVALGQGLALLSLLPVLSLKSHLYPYYLLLATVGLAWAYGALAAKLWEQQLRDGMGNGGGIAAVLVGAVLVAAFAWLATHDRLTRRTYTGELHHPFAANSAMAAEVHRTVRALPLEPGQTLAVLSATTRHLPEDLPWEDAVARGGRVYGAIQGLTGLQLMVPDGVRVRWEAHLDGLRRDSLVLFDGGAPQLRFWGRVQNARLYSAIVAIAAGQYSRARHDLWTLTGENGSLADFLYQPEALPVPRGHIDEMSPAFVDTLLSEGSIDAQRIIKLYEQLYEAVQGRPLSELLRESVAESKVE